MELAREVWQENTAPMLSRNVGTGVDCTIRELAQTIAKVVNLPGAGGGRRHEAGRHAA